MTLSGEHYLTTRELAELLRIKERKIYDLAANGEVPCIRVVGKLLFPRAEIETWLANARSGPVAPLEIPDVFAGSHDPLLEWALRESGCGIAAMFDGSFDGLQRFAEGKVLACGLHIHQDDGWNLNAVRDAVGGQPVVLLGFAKRQRGLLVAFGNPKSIAGIADLAELRFAKRQHSAASSQLFDSLSRDAGIDAGALDGPRTAARTEDDVALMVLEGQADAAFGLAGVAKRLGLGFVPLLTEQFDLLVWRHCVFEAPFQRLIRFLGSNQFQSKALTLDGYDIAELGTVRLNGAAR